MLMLIEYEFVFRHKPKRNVKWQAWLSVYHERYQESNATINSVYSAMLDQIEAANTSAKAKGHFIEYGMFCYIDGKLQTGVLTRQDGKAIKVYYK